MDLYNERIPSNFSLTSFVDSNEELFKDNCKLYPIDDFDDFIKCQKEQREIELRENKRKWIEQNEYEIQQFKKNLPLKHRRYQQFYLLKNILDYTKITSPQSHEIKKFYISQLINQLKKDPTREIDNNFIILHWQNDVNYIINLHTYRKSW